MKVVTTISALKSAVSEARKENKQVGLVPTMGALHEGHLSLVNKACEECDFVVVSIFVNPTQFNNPEDLRTYPRTLEADKSLLESQTRADVIFAPIVEEVYPEPDTRIFDFGPLAEVMEGKYRPGHFNGVGQIVSKLFMFVEPDKAYFGEKDFQQLAIIRKMTKDLKMDIDIVPCPIVREADGLAKSSRNTLLTKESREVAPQIYAALKGSKQLTTDRTPKEVAQWVVGQLNSTEGLEVEYYEIVDGNTLQPINTWQETDYAVGCITVYAGKVRLIDNITYKA